MEIKRSCHPELWSAIRTQLVAKYTCDLATGGHGVYLLFWFGSGENCRPGPPKPLRTCGRNSGIPFQIGNAALFRPALPMCPFQRTRPPSVLAID